VRKTDRIGLVDERWLSDWMENTKIVGLFDQIHFLHFLTEMEKD
jgi:hypothetical protein